MAASTISIILVHPHPLLRESLSMWLTNRGGMRVVGEAVSDAEAWRMCLANPPKVVVMDADLLSRHSLGPAGYCSMMCKVTKLVLMSACVLDESLAAARQIGVSAYIKKEDAPEAVLHAIQEAMAGHAYFSPELRDRLTRCAGRPEPGTPEHNGHPRLSDRELEVLHLVVENMATKRIAKTLHLSPRTVERHLDRLMDKLGLHGRIELVRYAIREGYERA